MFQQYPQKDVNEPVLLHEGRFRVQAGDRCIEPSGSAHLRWLPSPGIEFDIETDVPHAGLGLDSTVELPGCRTKKVAVMRKLLILANTLVQQDRIWTTHAPREYSCPVFPAPCQARSGHG